MTDTQFVKGILVFSLVAFNLLQLAQKLAIQKGRLLMLFKWAQYHY